MTRQAEWTKGELPGAAPATDQDEGSQRCHFGAQSHGPFTHCLSLRIQGQPFDFFSGMLAASLDSAIFDHMDTIHWSDLLSTNTC